LYEAKPPRKGWALPKMITFMNIYLGFELWALSFELPAHTHSS